MKNYCIFNVDTGFIVRGYAGRPYIYDNREETELKLTEIKNSDDFNSLQIKEVTLIVKMGI